MAEARREFRKGPGRPLRGGVSVTKALLVAIVIPFVIEIVVGGPQALFNPSAKLLFDLGAMQPIAVAGGQFWRLFTAMFLHAGVLHVALNAYFFWLFGRVVESVFGKTWMLLIYLVAGFLASVASYAFGPVTTLAVGASGAISGVFGAFIAYNYRRRHLTANANNLRMALTVIVLNAVIAFAYRSIDWRAHVGGLIAGFALGYLADDAVPAGSAGSRSSPGSRRSSRSGSPWSSGGRARSERSPGSTSSSSIPRQPLRSSIP